MDVVVLSTSEPISLTTLAYIRVIAPLVLLVVPLVFAIPFLAPVRRLLGRLLPDLVPLASLVPADPPTKEQQEEIKRNGPKLWRQIIFVTLGVVETAVWAAVFGRTILWLAHRSASPRDVVLSAGMVAIWIYLTARPLIRPASTPPWASLGAYLVLWLISLTTLAMSLYVRIGTGSYPYWATTTRILAEAADVVITTILVGVISGMPLAPPEVLARLRSVADDDRSTLFSWLSFTWMNPFIAFGSTRELNAEDLPVISLTLQASEVFNSFKSIATSTLLRRMLLAHRLDFFLDFILTALSVVFNYASPFFMKKILDGLTEATPEAMSRAYVFAFFAFVASTLKAMVDLLHLWHGRRGSVRIRAELIAAIYDKALRRKDASGVVAAKEEEETDAAKKDGKDGKKPEEKKADADTGKIVNLMAGDSTRIAGTFSSLYMIYSAPVEIVIASVFLYQLLGWTAFAGIIVVAVAVPTNTFLSKQSIRITKELLKARDKRVTTMSELINAIQFIKFFAWVQQWKARASEARANERKIQIKSMINSMLFSLLWNLVPIFVTLLSFFCYIVIAKQELSVSVAFTAISLFNMLQQPLNVLPVFIVMVMQSLVAVQRIQDFLDEDEVPDWVSSLKRGSSSPDDGPTRVGFSNATLRWNTGTKLDKDDKDKKDKKDKKGKKGQPNQPETNEETSSSTPAENQIFYLSQLNVEFPVGKLSVVTGPTGAGKSALLTALLGEMDLLEGKIYLPKKLGSIDPATGLRNSVAYAAQTPWLQQKSIKDNILFGEPLDEARYQATLEACALVQDLDVLEDGDETEIGAKGISLSGGQKARVALARAVYSYTQHLLLDDPLAAVDSHTAKHLTDKCLNGPLLKGRTVILVSHHVELLLPSAEYLIRVLDGRIDAKGTPAELRAAGQLDGLIALEEAEAHEEPAARAEDIEDEAKAVEGEGDAPAEKKEKKKGPGKKLIKDEERQVGNVKWETYSLYIKAATYTTWTLFVICLIVIQLVNLSQRYWLKIWGEAYQVKLQTMFSAVRMFSGNSPDHTAHNAHQHVFYHSPVASNVTSMDARVTVQASLPIIGALPSAKDRPEFYLGVYTAILLASAVVSLIDDAVSYWGQWRAGGNIHDQLLDVMMRGSIRFFTVTPVGRIINRFSKDIETIDENLSSSINMVVSRVANLMSAIIVIAFVVPWFLVPAAVISYLYWRYTVLYLRVGRSVRRLEATSRSPIFSGFGELLDGVVSVRAFSAEASFFDRLCVAVDKTNSAFYYYWMMNRWLLLRFDVLGAISVFLTTLFALGGGISAGSAGLAIIYAQTFVSACYWLSRFWGSLEMNFNAVERVQEYLDIPTEPPGIIESNRPPAYWPSATRNPDHFLSAQEVEIKYAPDLPTVFQGSFDIKAGEKIGLIGRTGSGKSTLAMSILRFVDPTAGKIVLDGIDITSIGVDDLRSRITYIPQDAVLFSGTVRDNLDPFNEHSDDELLDALARVNLGPRAAAAQSAAPSRQPSHAQLASLQAAEQKGESSESGAATPLGGKVTVNLSTEVSSGGGNFSQGQRQLIAMARALLRRSNLIIMDEATASVDFATDEAIQKAIRSEFKDSTLLTIAHRLSSVIDYDRLLVLADGTVAEFDTPINLLRKEGSLFKNLCEKSGRYTELYRSAERKEAGEAEGE